MTKKQVKPFDFSKLKKLSSRQVHLANALFDRFPQFSEGERTLPHILETLKKDFDLEVEFQVRSLDESTYAEFIDNLPAACLTILLKLEPTDQKMVVDIDYVFCRRILDKVLGGEGAVAADLSPLSPMETGVLEYLLLKLWSQISLVPGLEGTTAFRLMKIIQEPKLLSDISSHDEAGCVLKCFLRWKEWMGAVRIYLPHPLVEGLFLREDRMAGVVKPGEEGFLERQMERVSHVKTFLFSEIGRVSLMASERDQLEKGDVILFDETSAAMSAEGLTGKTILRVGDGEGGGLLAELVDTDHKVVAKVLDFYGG